MPISKEEMYRKMEDQCLQEIRESGWWIFNKKKILFEPTKMADEMNIQTPGQLPDKVCLSKNCDEVAIRSDGIMLYSRLYSWDEILATGIKTEVIPMELMDNYKTSILVGLKSGSILELENRDSSWQGHQIGHLIELFKLKFMQTKQ